MSRPLFSIIVPTYNRAAWIRKTLESALNQTYSNIEVIIVDDGSTDATEEVIASIKNERLRYVKKVNGERGSARNYGASVAKGDYLSFLDSDDLLYRHHVETAIEIISTHPGIQMFHMAYDFRDEQGDWIRDAEFLPSLKRAILQGNPLSCNGVVMTREVALSNPFSENRALSGLEDWELWIRLNYRYGIATFSKVTSTVVDHVDRSVLIADSNKIVSKVETFCQIVKATLLQNLSSVDVRLVHASALGYGALHLALAGASRKLVLHHLARSIRLRPFTLLSRRTLVIFRLLLWPSAGLPPGI